MITSIRITLPIQLLLLSLLTSTAVAQYGFPTVVTDPEALALLASGHRSSLMTMDPSYERHTATAEESDGSSPLGPEDVMGTSQDSDPSAPTGYTFSINHQMMDHMGHKKFYEQFADPSVQQATHEDGGPDQPQTTHKQHQPPPPPPTPHRTHKHQHQLSDGQTDKESRPLIEYDQQAGQEAADKHKKHQGNEDQAAAPGTNEKRGKKKKGHSYPRRPQYDEVFEPQHILLEPQQHAHPHLEQDVNPYYKNMGYDYADTGDVSYRSDFYWLIPLTIIIGIAALILPMLSFFMTIMVSNGAINLSGLSGRRKRSFDQPDDADALLILVTRLESAIAQFSSQKS